MPQKHKSIVKCQNILKDMANDNYMDCLKNLVNPMEYTDINHHLLWMVLER